MDQVSGPVKNMSKWWHPSLILLCTAELTVTNVLTQHYEQDKPCQENELSSLLQHQDDKETVGPVCRVTVAIVWCCREQPRSAALHSPGTVPPTLPPMRRSTIVRLLWQRPRVRVRLSCQWRALVAQMWQWAWQFVSRWTRLAPEQQREVSGSFV